MHVDDDLVEAFVKRKAVIFAGAGVSVAAGLPNWKGLMDGLRDGITDCPDGEFSPLDLAQYYVNERGEHGLVGKLSEILEKKNIAPTEIHCILTRLSADRIYTTNFDTLLEAASKKNGRDAVEISDFSQLSRKTDALQVIKLHGSLSYPKALVLTADQFEGYFESHKALADTIAAELREKTVLFVGYSFSDPDIRTILRAVARDTEGRIAKPYILQFNPKRPVMEELGRRHLRVERLDVPSFTSERATAALTAWLRELESLVRARTPWHGASHNLPQLQAKLVGRDSEKANLMEAIRKRPAIAIIGPSGIGKTSLALRIGYEFATQAPPREFDYIVWIAGREHPERQQWLSRVLDAVGETLGSPRIARRGSDQLAKKITEVDVLLDLHRTLIVLDNFEIMHQPELDRWIRTIPPSSKVLITALTDLGGSLPGVPYPLEPLRGPDAFELLEQYSEEFDSTAFAHDRVRATRLINASGGNPLALKLALGIVHREPSRFGHIAASLDALKGDIEKVFEQLYEWAWGILDSDAERLLLIPALFPGVGSIRRDALEAAARIGEQFAEALRQVERLGLVELSTSGRYMLHGRTRKFALRQLEARPKLPNEVRARCADHYLKFVRDTIKRTNPSVRYWDALVTEKMEKIDPEWPMIRELMDWANQDGDDNREQRDRVLIDFVMLLVHYMDSRFLNRERLDYVKGAAAALQRSGAARSADEALLRIDALGWTFVEESDWASAHREIDRGYELAEASSSDERLDLLALARAWKARALIEQGQAAEANAAMAEALALQSGCSPWISMRVNMAAGDIALKERRDHDAFMYFEAAAAAAEDYGAEGSGYQIKPRLGMALMNLNRIDEASAQFEAVRRLGGIPIGNLYGEYGRALIAYELDDVEDAVRRVNSARQQLAQKTASNLLLRLLTEFSVRRAIPLQPLQ